MSCFDGFFALYLSYVVLLTGVESLSLLALLLTKLLYAFAVVEFELLYLIGGNIGFMMVNWFSVHLVYIINEVI